MRGHWLPWAALSVLATACGAQDAGTYCEQDYHCISGSCTWHSCDAFPSCWPSCGDGEPLDPPEPPPRQDWPRPTLDAGLCMLRLCSELSLSECDVEPGCERIKPCSADASDLTSVRFGPPDAGAHPRCGDVERCEAWLLPDVRIHPWNGASCF
jgi:hypothetical protein